MIYLLLSYHQGRYHGPTASLLHVALWALPILSYHVQVSRDKGQAHFFLSCVIWAPWEMLGVYERYPTEKDTRGQILSWDILPS